MHHISSEVKKTVRISWSGKVQAAQVAWMGLPMGLVVNWGDGCFLLCHWRLMGIWNIPPGKCFVPHCGGFVSVHPSVDVSGCFMHSLHWALKDFPHLPEAFPCTLFWIRSTQWLVRLLNDCKGNCPDCSCWAKQSRDILLNDLFLNEMPVPIVVVKLGLPVHLVSCTDHSSKL